MARPKNTYLDQLIPAFLEGSQDRIRTDSSRKTYRRMLGQLASDLGAKPLHKVTEDDLVAFCTVAKGSGQLAPRTMSSRRSKVDRFFTWAHRAGHIPTNPALGLRDVVRPRVRNVRRHNWLTSTEARLMLDSCPDSPIGRRDRVVLSLGLYAGLRAYEIQNLKWHNVMADHLTLDITKGEKAAVVGLPAGLREALDAWRQDVPAEPDQYVACSMRHQLSTSIGRHTGETTVVPTEGLGRDGVRLAVMRACERTGLTARPHDLRRTFAGLLEEKGHGIEVISKALRHEQLSTTQTYLQDNPRKALDALGGFEL